MALVHGKPMLQWTIEAALKAERLDRIFLSSDDDEMIRFGSELGVEAPFKRPLELSRDDSSHVSVALHFLDWIRENERNSPAYFMVLQPTSPLRNEDDIDAAIELALAKRAEAVVGVCEASPHPALTYKRDSEGTMEPYFESRLVYERRQDLPEALAINGAIYLQQTEAFQKSQSFVPRNAIPYIMPPDRSIDVDTPIDLDIVELIMSKRSKHGV